MTAEREIQRAATLALTDEGARVWRNNVGTACQGDVQRFAEPTKTTVYPGDVVIRHARYVKYGLAEGSSDLIGLYPLLVTPAMVGRRVATFVSAEAKNEVGNTTKLQRAWLAMVSGCGGIGFSFRSTDAALTELRNSVKKIQSGE